MRVATHITGERPEGQPRLAGSGFGLRQPPSHLSPAGRGRGLSVLLPDPTATTPEAGSGNLAAGERKGYRGTRTFSEHRGPRSARGLPLPPFSRRTDSADRCGPLLRRQGTIGGCSAASETPPRPGRPGFPLLLGPGRVLPPASRPGAEAGRFRTQVTLAASGAVSASSSSTTAESDHTPSL